MRGVEKRMTGVMSTLQEMISTTCVEKESQEMKALLEALQEKVGQLQQDCCDVVVQGSFTVGKSYFINALLGQELLPVSALSCTSFPICIEQGKPSVTLCREHGESVMTLEEFQKWAPYTLQDREQMMQTGEISRFQDVRYASIRMQHPLLQHGMRIIDCPGLDDNYQATRFAVHASRPCSLMVYVTDAKGLTLNDMEYLKHYAAKHCLFVMNKKDMFCSADEMQQGIDRTRNMLATLRPDQDLGQRLFAVSALQARCAQKGVRYDYCRDEEVAMTKVQAQRALRDSGIPQVKAALTQYAADYARKGYRDDTVEDLLNQAERAIKAHQRRLEEAKREKRLLMKREVAVIDQSIQQVDCEQQHIGVALDKFLIQAQCICRGIPQGYAERINQTWGDRVKDICQKMPISKSNYWKLGLDRMNIFISEKEREERTWRLLQPLYQAFFQYMDNEMKKLIAEKSRQLEQLEKDLQSSMGWTDRILVSATNGVPALCINPSQQLSYSASTSLGNSACKAIIAIVAAQVVTGGIGALATFLFANSRAENSCNTHVVTLLSKLKEESMKYVLQQASKQVSLSCQHLAYCVEQSRKHHLKEPKARIRLLQARKRMLLDDIE